MSIKLRQLVINKLFDSWRPTVAAFDLSKFFSFIHISGINNNYVYGSSCNSPIFVSFPLFCFLYLVVSTNVQYFLASHPALGMSVNRKKRKMSENMV